MTTGTKHGKGERWPLATRERGIRLWLAGIPGDKISRVLGVPISVVWYWSRIPVRKTGRPSKYTEEQKEQARELLIAGLTFPEVEQKTGINRHTVKYWWTVQWNFGEIPELKEEELKGCIVCSLVEFYKKQGEYPLGEQIRRHRVNLGISQHELEERLAVNRGYISRVENDHFVPSVRMLRKIAVALGEPLVLSGDKPKRKSRGVAACTCKPST